MRGKRIRLMSVTERAAAQSRPQPRMASRSRQYHDAGATMPEPEDRPNEEPSERLPKRRRDDWRAIIGTPRTDADSHLLRALDECDALEVERDAARKVAETYRDRSKSWQQAYSGSYSDHVFCLPWEGGADV